MKTNYKNMSIVLNEWWLTTDTAEKEIGNLSLCDQNAENLSLYCEKMYHRIV